jgi:hypothetical protein
MEREGRRILAEDAEGPYAVAAESGQVVDSCQDTPAVVGTHAAAETLAADIRVVEGRYEVVDTLLAVVLAEGDSLD